MIQGLDPLCSEVSCRIHSLVSDTCFAENGFRNSRLCYHRAMLKLSWLLLAWITFLTLTGLPAYAQIPSSELERFLDRYAHFSKADLRALAQGRPVAKELNTNRATDVAAFGIIRVNVAKAVFVQRFQDISSFKKSDYVLSIGKLSQDPQAADFDRLALDRSEITKLEQCTVGDCGFQLSAEAIQFLRSQLSRSQSIKTQSGTGLFREMLLRYVREYLAKGNVALVRYNDRNPVRSLAHEFQDMLADSAYLEEYVPELRDYLLNFPLDRPPDTDSFVYWSKEKFGLKPIISVTHVMMYPRITSRASAVIIASKQIYASHYFDASLGLGAFLQFTGNPQRTYLMYLNRSRSSLLGGWLGFIKRPLVKRRIRNGLLQNLQLARRKLEQ